jgi:hypothetical protein
VVGVWPTYTTTFDYCVLALAVSHSSHRLGTKLPFSFLSRIEFLATPSKQYSLSTAVESRLHDDDDDDEKLQFRFSELFILVYSI